MHTRAHRLRLTVVKDREFFEDKKHKLCVLQLLTEAAVERISRRGGPGKCGGGPCIHQNACCCRTALHISTHTHTHTHTALHIVHQSPVKHVHAHLKKQSFGTTFKNRSLCINTDQQDGRELCQCRAAVQMELRLPRPPLPEQHYALGQPEGLTRCS